MEAYLLGGFRNQKRRLGLPEAGMGYQTGER